MLLHIVHRGFWQMFVVKYYIILCIYETKYCQINFLWACGNKFACSAVDSFIWKGLIESFFFFPHFIYFWLSFGCETQNENFWSISKTMKGNEDWSCKTLKWQKAPKKWFMTCALYSWSMIGYKSSVWGTEQYLSRYSLKILKSALALLWCIHKSSW